MENQPPLLFFCVISTAIIIFYILKSKRNAQRAVDNDEEDSSVKSFPVRLTFIGKLSIKFGRGNILVHDDHIFIKDSMLGGLDTVIHSKETPQPGLLPLKFEITDIKEGNNVLILRGRLKRALSNNRTTIRISSLDEGKAKELAERIKNMFNLE